MKKLLVLLIAGMSFCACNDDDKRTIDIELEDFIKVFEQEALLRGIEIDVNSLEVEAHISMIDENDVVGQCYTFSNDTREIIIDEYYWSRLDYLEREYLMMHELGHCVLERGHINDENNNGNCKSIMQSGTGECRKRYTNENRSWLLDELFKI